MMDFTNISEILDFFVANLGILDKPMISGSFPHAKLLKTETFPREIFPRETFPETDKNGLGEKFLGGNVSGGEGFPCVRISEMFPDFGISGKVQLPGYL